MRSQYGKTNWLDWLYAAGLTALVAFLGTLATTITEGGFPSGAVIVAIACTSLSTGAGYILKQFTSNSLGLWGKKEPDDSI